MRFYLISDNEDTLVGMRLAGIDGVIVHNEEEAQREINKAMENPEEIAVVLIAEKVVDMCSDFVYDLKLNRKRPLIVDPGPQRQWPYQSVDYPVCPRGSRDQDLVSYFILSRTCGRNGG